LTRDAYTFVDVFISIILSVFAALVSQISFVTFSFHLHVGRLMLHSVTSRMTSHASWCPKSRLWTRWPPSFHSAPCCSLAPSKMLMTILWVAHMHIRHSHTPFN